MVEEVGEEEKEKEGVRCERVSADQASLTSLPCSVSSLRAAVVQGAGLSAM